MVRVRLSTGILWLPLLHHPLKRPLIYVLARPSNYKFLSNIWESGTKA